MSYPINLLTPHNYLIRKVVSWDNYVTIRTCYYFYKLIAILFYSFPEKEVKIKSSSAL